MALPHPPNQSESEASRAASQASRHLGDFLKNQTRKASQQAGQAVKKAAKKAAKAAVKMLKRAAMQALRSAITYIISLIGIPALIVILLAAVLTGIFLAGGASQHAYTVKPPSAKTKALDHRLTQAYKAAARQSRPGSPVPHSLAVQWQVPWGVLAAVDRIDAAHIRVKQDTTYSPQLARALRPHLRIVNKPMVETVTTITNSGNGSVSSTSSRQLSPFPAVVYAHSWNAISHIQWQLHYEVERASHTTTIKRHGHTITTTTTTVTRIPYYEISSQQVVTNYSLLNAAISANPFRILDGQADDSLIVQVAMSFQGALPNWVLNGIGQWVGTYTGPVPPPNASIEQSVEFWSKKINEAAKTYHVPAAFVAAIMAPESGGDPRAISSRGAIGLMQVMPDHFTSGQNPWDAMTNIDVGTAYIASLASQFNNNWSLVAAAYNAGPGAVETYHGIPPYPQTMAYVPEVLAYYRAFQKASQFNS